MDDPDPTDLLRQLDAALTEACRLRDLLAKRLEVGMAAEANGADEADDLAAEHMIEVSTAVHRFNRPPDSIRWMCRERDCGRKIGGRWMVSAPRLARYLNGGE